MQSMFERAFSKYATHLVTRSSHGLICKAKTVRYLLDELCSAVKGFIGILTCQCARGVQLSGWFALICGS